MSSLLAFTAPGIDFHAFAPEIIVAATIVVVLLLDLFTEQRSGFVAWVASMGLLIAAIPLITLATGTHEANMFGNGAYVVDNFSLVLKGVFLLSGWLVIMLSLNYIGEGDYWEHEYYELLLCSILGMMIMASARDLISMFIALELLSIPAYMLAAWRKRNLKSEEAGMKYYLMGVFASGIMLYGMSLLYGLTGSTVLANIAATIGQPEKSTPIITLAIIFVLIGFAFKVSAVPFHTWAPDTYEGAPTPVTAFLAVASKAAGFVALVTLLFVGFKLRSDVFQPLMFALSIATMFVGNLIALRQDNMVRMLAYSGIAQAGYMLAPLAVIGNAQGNDVLSAVVGYLIIYAVMNLGAFAVIITVSRKTRSADIHSFGGLFTYAPGLTVAMTIFLFSLAGIPPLGGWYAKFGIFTALVSANTTTGYVLAVAVAVNSVIAAFYYARVAKTMWFDPVPDGDVTPITIPLSLRAAVVITAVLTIAIGVYPGLVTRLSDSTCLAPAKTECVVAAPR
jgi:NADH-quinone oxidoreductase subunit N